MKPRHVYRPPRPNRFRSTVLIIFGGLLFTFLVFYVIPLMQQLEQSMGGDEEDLIANIASQPPPEFETPDEEEEPEEQEEDPPPMEEVSDDIQIDPLDIPDLGAGGTGRINVALAPDVSFSSEDLGDSVSEIDSPPIAKSKYDPNIPRKVKKQLKAKGGARVVVSGVVDARGKVGQTRVTGSSGIAQLDELCVSALQRWSFKPAIQNGRKAKAKISQTFNFPVKK